MRIRVIAEDVATIHDLLRERGKCAHAAPDDEEGCARVVPVEQIEQFRRDGGIRAIVEGERYG